MSSWTDEAKKLLQLAGSGLTGLEMIGEIIQPLLDSKTAALDASTLSVLRTIHAIVDTLKQGAAGTVGLDQVNSALTHLRAQIEANDRQAQADIDAKFPG
jgi:hypothetical protein